MSSSHLSHPFNLHPSLRPSLPPSYLPPPLFLLITFVLPAIWPSSSAPPSVFFLLRSFPSRLVLVSVATAATVSQNARQGTRASAHTVGSEAEHVTTEQKRPIQWLWWRNGDGGITSCFLGHSDQMFQSFSTAGVLPDVRVWFGESWVAILFFAGALSIRSLWNHRAAVFILMLQLSLLLFSKQTQESCHLKETTVYLHLTRCSGVLLCK